ncbi:MAG: LysM peptidoglycan-binding domain-containing protein, partial [Gammaproteobacteria bacterium]|nr:LysM peptidoglycan-binding domain-containing protein [Gammaproteobacteria bacterium]
TTPEATREGQYELKVSSESALYEPMYELELKVQCPGAPVMVRQYVLMLDLPSAVSGNTTTSASPANLQAPAVAVTTPPPSARPVSEAVSPRPTRSQATTFRPGTTIASGSVYRVSEGDTLSSIAARVRDRGVSLWTLADAIQAANPGAFIRNDANLIKLGSEIRIPEAPATGAPVASSLPSPETIPVVPPTPAPTMPAVVTSMPAAPASTPIPAVTAKVAAPVARRPVEPKPAPTPTDEAVMSSAAEANPFAAAGAGILFGLCVSALLWFRGRMPSRKRPAASQADNPDAPSQDHVTAIDTVVEPLVTRKFEPGFTVSYSAQYDDSLASEFLPEAEPVAAAPAASDEITSELAKLFDGTDTTIRKRLDTEKTMAARSLANGSIDDFDAAGIGQDSAVDFLVGELAEDNDATLSAQTVDQPRPEVRSTSDSGTVDIHALAESATKDQQQAQTLLEALTLLERDYEQELTASQVLDMSAVRKALDESAEPTQISAAIGRKKAR